MNNFDNIVMGAMEIAQSNALERNNSELTHYHLLYGLISNPNSWLSKKIIDQKDNIISQLNQVPQLGKQASITDLKASPRLSEWLTFASGNAAKAGKQEIAEKDLIKFMPKFFPELKIDYSQLNELDEQLERPAFLLDLNELAEENKLDPVIGRGKEIRAVVEILGRRSKNNPVLVGSAGVGKTAIVEGLAEKIFKNEVPDILKGKRIYSMNLGELMSDTKYRGSFEKKIQELLKFMKSQNGQAILFIDEIHQLVGAGKTDGAMDAANLLKPALARGELHCIGATTYDEYQKYILNDSALERRFRSVTVNEPTIEDSVEILMGLKEKFELHHGIKISDDAIFGAVKLSDQYLKNKNLPDKAIDLIDEAASSLKLSAQSLPSDVEEIASEIRSKKILAQFEKNNDLDKEIKELEEVYNNKKGKWLKEVEKLREIQNISEKIDKYKYDLERAQRDQDYETASKIKYSLLPELESQKKSYSHEWVLNRDHIARVISRATGIPKSKILKTQQEKVLGLEKYLAKYVYGQDDALKEISETLYTSFAGLKDDSRPLGSFLLKGPTGVGKTETAKAISRFLFDNEDNITRIDLSEFSEKHSVAKLIGAPAGYIGYDDGGILTEAIRRKPFSVILFDEVEKAHRDFSDILLQILDDGRLTDNKGRTIDFKNTIILLTTNSKNLDQDFKPELLGRLDGILEYKPLDETILDQLIEKEVNLLNNRIKSKNITVELTDDLIKRVKLQGYDMNFGARPLKGVFNKVLLRPLSVEFLKSGAENLKYIADYKDEKVLFTTSNI